MIGLLPAPWGEVNAGDDGTELRPRHRVGADVALAVQERPAVDGAERVSVESDHVADVVGIGNEGSDAVSVIGGVAGDPFVPVGEVGGAVLIKRHVRSLAVSRRRCP